MWCEICGLKIDAGDLAVEAHDNKGQVHAECLNVQTERQCESCGKSYRPAFGQRFCSGECIPHGTKARYEYEKKRGEVCDLCRHAGNAYMAQWRGRNTDGFRRQQQRQAARSRAMAKLAREYPRRFNKLLEAELEDA